MLRNPVRTAVAALIAMSALSGCTLEPHYKRPDLPVPEQWPLPENSTPMPSADAGATGASQTSVWEIGWREFFTDPQLQQLIAQALANNRDVRVAVLNVELARAQYHVQRANLLPKVDANGSYTREKIPPALAFGTQLPPGTTIPLEKIYQVGVGVSSWEIDLFGRVRSQSHAALQQYLAQEQARRSAQLSLIAQVAGAYLTLAADRELDRLALETLKGQEASYDLTRQRHESGAVSGLDLAQARTTVEQARVDAARFEGNVAQDVDALALLIGGAVDAGTLPRELDANITGLAPLPPALPSTVLLRRPDILQAEHQLRAANADIGAARAAFFPSINLTGAIGS
ncbi:MAG TPA: efflux transporter outer membrane subunit, partial [Steroidobacteraceae bacterium]|nr:efflux transporter outer membrane subunit [Steroidobacteraceae bacterium]